MLSTLAGFGQFRNSAGTAFPYTNNLAASDVFVLGKPGNTNLNVSASNLLQELADVAATPNAIPIGITGNALTATVATNLAAIPQVAAYVAAVGITDTVSSNQIHMFAKTLQDAGILSSLVDACFLRSNLNHGTLASIKTFLRSNSVTLVDSSTMVYDRNGLYLPGSATQRAYWTQVPDTQTNTFQAQCATWLQATIGGERCFVRYWDGDWSAADLRLGGFGLFQGGSGRINLRYAHRDGGAQTFAAHNLYNKAGWLGPTGWEFNYIIGHNPGTNLTVSTDGVNGASGNLTNYITSALGTYGQGMTNIQIGEPDATYQVPVRVSVWTLFSPTLNAAGERALLKACRYLDGKPKNMILYGDSRIVHYYNWGLWEKSWSGRLAESDKFSEYRFYDGAQGGSTTSNHLSDVYFTNIMQWFPGGPVEEATVLYMSDWNDSNNDKLTAVQTWANYSNLTVKLKAYPRVKVEAILPGDGVTGDVTNQAIHQLIRSNSMMFSRIVEFEQAINAQEFQAYDYSSGGNPHYSTNAQRIYADFYTHGRTGHKPTVVFLPATVTTGAWTWTNIWGFTRTAYGYGGTVTHVDVGTNRVAVASPFRVDVPAGMILTVSNSVVPTALKFYP